MDKNELFHLLEYATLAYNTIQPQEHDTRLIAINDKTTDIQCFVRIMQTKILIAFRGTDSKKDWGTDLTFCKMKMPYDNHNSKIRVHSGFVEAYKSKYVRDELHSILKENSEINKIILTGHSYGAALAVLCAVDLQYHFPEKDFEVALFGCPRVGNLAFSRSYNKRVFKTLRVENGNDMFTKLPFVLLGFSHVGAKVHIGKWHKPFVFSPLAHYPTDYYKALWARYTP
jgi:Lipase (class 3).